LVTGVRVACPRVHCDLHHFALDSLYILIGLKVRRENGTVEDVVFEDALKLLDVFGVRRCLRVSAPSAVKASLVGAKTVKGPLVERVFVSSPAVRALTKVVRP